MTDTLAILGGTPVRSGPMPRYNTIGVDEREAVLRVLESGELSGFIAGGVPEFWGGPEVRALEEQVSARFGRPAIALNSATSGLHAALAALGCGPGDEVIVPPFTMMATATTVLFTGAVPVFVDIDERTFCVDAAAVEAAITPHTRGIVAVNIFGHPAELDRLRTLADRHGLFLLEDNAQAPGANFHGRPTGTFGDAGVFSLNRHKTIQSGEGGVVLCRDEEVALRVALVRNHGECAVDALGVEDITNTVGLNYRMTEMEAAVARCQFAKLDDLTRARAALAARLTEGLRDLEGITAPYVAPDCTHVYYFYVMRYDADVTGIPRDLFVDAVAAEGFPLRAGYLRPIYLERVFQEKRSFGAGGFPFTANPRNDELSYQQGICPVVERLNEREIMLTNAIYPPLTSNDMDSMVEAYCKVLRNRDALLAASST